MKVGNTHFNESVIKDMPFSEFEKTYKNILKGISLEDAYIKLGGSIKKSKKIEESE